MTDYLSSDFLGRVQRAYRLALASSTAGNSTIWAPIDRRRSSVHAALVAEDDEALRNVFSNPVSSDLFLGADYLCHSVLGQLSVGHSRDLRVLAALAGERVERLDSEGVADHLAKWTKKKLLLFAEVAGVSHTEETKSILSGLDNLLAQTVSFPNLAGEFGLPTSRGIATYRAVLSLHQTWIILNHLRDQSTKSVVEIGPGLGRTAYYVFRSGVTDYTTVDLPMGIVAQACFLGAALGPDKIVLHGEDDRAGCIKLYVAGTQPLDKKYTVAFNSDSMTEMTMSAAMRYANWIWGHCGAFISINHGGNLFTVEDISKKWLTLERCGRCPMQEGYVTEYFVPREAPSFVAWGKISLHLVQVAKRRLLDKTSRSLSKLKNVGR